MQTKRRWLSCCQRVELGREVLGGGVSTARSRHGMRTDPAVRRDEPGGVTIRGEPDHALTSVAYGTEPSSTSERSITVEAASVDAQPAALFGGASFATPESAFELSSCPIGMVALSLLIE